MFSIGQQAAVRGAFRLAGYDGPLSTLVVDSPDERTFVLAASDLAGLRELRVLEQIVQQALGCKVWVVEQRSDLRETVPVE